MTFPAKLAFIQPLWFLVALVPAFAVPVVMIDASVEVLMIGALISTWAILLPLGWACGIYAASRHLAANGSAGRTWIFYVAGIGVLILPPVIIASDAMGSIGAVPAAVAGYLGFAVVGSYFVCLWLGSAALVAFEEGEPKPPFHKVAGTFFLMVYWVIGVWVMQGRLKALRHKLEAAPV
ncbi:MAG: hypothetical protein KKF88_04770 [Alphaproteobacteria bacterium]|nr:hypothetical protein [Alphaproteobacteria bacterium]